MLTIDEIRKAVCKIGKRYGIKNAYLFGSYAKGTASENSDVDLMIDKGGLRTYKDFFHFCDELETELGTSVDITSEDGMFPGFFDLIKNDRILLYGI